MSKLGFRSLLLLMVLLLLVWLPTQFSAPAKAQDPAGPPAQVGGLDSLGWPLDSRLQPVNRTQAAVDPVNCSLLTPPVVAYDLAKGQVADDIADLLADLVIDGYSVGTVDSSSGAIPACIDVLIVLGLRNGDTLSAAYTAAEAATLQTWVANGHGLLVSGDWGSFKDQVNPLFQAYGYSQQGTLPVTDPTDFDPAGPQNYWVYYQTDNFVANPILNGISMFEFRPVPGFYHLPLPSS